MRHETEFTVGADHLQLMRNMYVGWIGDEYGAPEINPKRPYGNSDVPEDIKRILQRDMSDEEARKLHEDTEVTLQIALYTAGFETGHYVRDKYGVNWRKEADRA